MEKMPTNEFLCGSHLLTANDAGSITSAGSQNVMKINMKKEYTEKFISNNSRIEFFWCSIWKTIIHV